MKTNSKTKKILSLVLALSFVFALGTFSSNTYAAADCKKEKGTDTAALTECVNKAKAEIKAAVDAKDTKALSNIFSNYSNMVINTTIPKFKKSKTFAYIFGNLKTTKVYKETIAAIDHSVLADTFNKLLKSDNNTYNKRGRALFKKMIEEFGQTDIAKDVIAGMGTAKSYENLIPQMDLNKMKTVLSNLSSSEIEKILGLLAKSYLKKAKKTAGTTFVLARSEATLAASTTLDDTANTIRIIIQSATADQIGDALRLIAEGLDLNKEKIRSYAGAIMFGGDGYSLKIKQAIGTIKSKNEAAYKILMDVYNEIYGDRPITVADLVNPGNDGKYEDKVEPSAAEQQEPVSPDEAVTAPIAPPKESEAGDDDDEEGSKAGNDEGEEEGVPYTSPNEEAYQAATQQSICSNDDVAESVKNAAGCNSEIKMENTFITVMNAVLGVLSVVAVVAIIYGGLHYMTSNGDAAKLQIAKKTIIYAVIGLVVCMFAAVIVNFIISKF